MSIVVESGDSQDFKQRDAASYDPVTGEYDRLVDRLSPPLVKRMIALARLTPSDRILDIGTGTGIVALQAARRIGPQGHILGIDLSDGMIAAAAAKAAEAGADDRVEFRKMDAEALALETGSCDVVLSLFALLHFPNPLAALREMWRVLRPGGRLVIAIGSRPPLLSLSGFIHRLGRLPELRLAPQGKLLTAPGYLNMLVEREFPGDSLPEESWLAQQGANRTRSVRQLVRRAGFSDVASYWQGETTVVESPEEFWELQATFSSLARKRLSDAPAERVVELKNEFLATCRDVQTRGGKLIYPFAAYYVTAERPPLV